MNPAASKHVHTVPVPEKAIPVPEKAIGADTVKKPALPLPLALPAQPRSDRATLTLLTGTAAGAAFGILRARETRIGRAEDADVHLDDPTISRYHARIVREAVSQYFLEDLGSTNGTFVNGQRVQRAMLYTGFRVQIGPEHVLRFALVDEAEELLQRRLYEGAITDPLTGAFNRKYLFERIESEVARARLHNEGLSLFMLDLDFFKRVNDNYGHEAGDRVLCALTACMRGVMRGSDLLARYGGEEFAVLARTHDSQEAAHLAERVRRAVEDAQIRAAPGAHPVTVSIGVSSLEEHGDARALVSVADRRLYAAKAAGRNRVVAEGA